MRWSSYPHRAHVLVEKQKIIGCRAETWSTGTGHVNFLGTNIAERANIKYKNLKWGHD